MKVARDLEKDRRNIFNENDIAMQNILAELNSEQMRCINKIQEHLGVVGEENKNNASCNCCDLDLSCLDYCGLCR